MAETKKTAKAASVVKSIGELRAELAAKRQELLNGRRSHKAGELVNPRALGQIRKEIARLLTAIRAQELAAEQENK
ncbi:MAG: 50S ribosomal protein L29 [Candidatus Saccharimonas sp.]|nr:50S ribosomal protein L29 [Candidatus Saccharibacteria bacterium]